MIKSLESDMLWGMVVIHIACVDKSIIGGVQVAVPQMIRAQSQFATVGCINVFGDAFDEVRMLPCNDEMNFSAFPPPFDHPDLVVFHEVYRFKYIKLYKKLVKSHIPYVVIPHGCLSKEAQKRKRLKKMTANVLFFKRFLRYAVAIQYLSENEKRLSAFKKYPSIVCGNGIELPSNKKSEFFKDGIRFVYIGRLEIITKGLDLLLAAVKRCQSSMRSNSAHLEIYGPNYDGEQEFLRGLANDYRVSDIVTIGGAKMGEEKKRILLSSDCFIQPSRTEALPMGPLEALSYGLPTIVTKAATLGEKIETYGAGLQAETSADGIAKAIIGFMNCASKIEIMSESSIRLVSEQYDIGRIAEQTVKEYSKLF